MKYIIPVLLLTGVFYVSSCSSDDDSGNLLVIPKSDSVTKGSFIELSFADKSFIINDLVVGQTPIYTLSADLTSFDQNDTLWIGQLLMTDHQSTTISLNLNVYNNTSGLTAGSYMVRTNNSTLTDFSDGANKVYAVSIGSIVNITDAGNPIEGTLSLNLYHNHTNFPATGSFKIYR